MMYFSSDKKVKQSIVRVFKGSLSGEYEIHVLRTTISEVVKNYCILKGKESARVEIYSLLKRYPIVKIPLNDSIVFDAGILKAQDRIRLSYNDCFSIMYCIQNKISFHTTEKKLAKIPVPTLKKLKSITYKWK